MKPKTIYKVNVAFQGTASLEIEAASPEEARLQVAELTVADLARTGHCDILVFKIAPREVTPIASLHGSEENATEEEGTNQPRPSGWYRPL